MACFSVPEPVPVPFLTFVPFMHRNYVPRVFKSYIKAFYKMIEMKTKILIIIMMINDRDGYQTGFLFL